MSNSFFSFSFARGRGACAPCPQVGVTGEGRRLARPLPAEPVGRLRAAGSGSPTCTQRSALPQPTGPSAPLSPQPTGPSAPLSPQPTGPSAPLSPRAMELLRGATLLLLLLAALAAVCWAQDDQACSCATNKRTTNCSMSSGTCQCTSFGSQVLVNCQTLTSKCLLMKAEMAALKKSGRRERPKHAYVDNDGIYDPDCENSGKFKARQCNGTSCWCVNTAGVRRTEKSDADLQCSELVRTSWILIETQHGERSKDVDVSQLKETIKNEFRRRYLLEPKYIHDVVYEKPLIIIELKQNVSQKSSQDVDIADVAYYFEKDVKGDSLLVTNPLVINVSEEPLKLDQTLIYYVDEKPPEFSMKRLTAGVIAVIVVVVLAIVAGIIVLVITRRRRGKYEKTEIKEMNEMQRELNP